MYKKGMGWSTIVGIIILVVSFAIILGWYITQGVSIVGEKEDITCKLSIIQAGSIIGTLKLQDLPKIRCAKIPVEIKADNKQEVMEKLADLMVKTSDTFCGNKVFTKAEGLYNKPRYSPITFTNKDLKISPEEIDYFLKENPQKSLCGLVFPIEGVDTSKDYATIFMAYYKEDWETYAKNIFLPKFLEISLKSQNEIVGLIRNDLVSREELWYLG